MSQSLAKNYIHLIFHVKYQGDTVRENDLPVLYSYISGILRNINCPSVCIGGTGNHVHILCVLNKNMALSKMVEEVKRSSSRWMKEQDKIYSRFAWQAGYGAFSVSQSKVDVVCRYIMNQAEHHKRMSFTDELKRFFQEYEIVYDERFLP